MDRLFSPSWLSDVLEPLREKFGCALTLSREGDVVRWGFAGQSAIVELRPDGKLSATFIDRENVDGVTNRPAAAAYHAYGPYARNAIGCSHMIADMVDFFSGEREPKFTFFDALAR